MEILGVLLVLGVVFAVVICPVIILVKLSGITAKLNDIEYKINILKDEKIPQSNRQTFSAPTVSAEPITKKPAAVSIQTAVAAPPEAPEPQPSCPVKVQAEPEEPKRTEFVHAQSDSAETSYLDRILETQSAKISAKLSSLEERSSAIIKNIISWFCVGEEYRSGNVAREYAIATTWLIRLGVIILLCGIGFFLKYSIDRNWTPPPVRVLFMTAAGLAMAILGAWKSHGKYRPLSIALSGAGFVTLYLSIMAAYKLYALIPPLAAFGFMIVITVGAIACALGTNALLPALLGCAGGYLTPVFISTGSQNITALFIYMTILSGGTLLAAYYRNWVLLNLSSLFFYVIIGGAAVSRFADADNALLIVILLAVNYLIFSLQQTAAAAKRDLSIVEIILTLGNLAFYFAAALPTANKYLSDMEMPALAALTAALIAIIELALIRRKFHAMPQVLTIFLEIKLCFSLVMTIPLLLGDVWVVTAWSVMALLLAEAAIRLRSRTLLIIALILYTVAGLRELFVQGAFYGGFDSYWRELLEHLLSGGVYIGCLAFTGVRLLRSIPPEAALDSSGNRPAAGMNILSQIILYTAATLFFIFSSYELSLFARHNLDTLFTAGGLLIIYWTVLSILLVYVITKYCRYKFLLVPLFLLIITGILLLTANRTFRMQENFLHGFIYTVLTAGIFIGGLFMNARQCWKISQKSVYAPDLQTEFKKIAIVLYVIGGILFFAYSSRELYKCLYTYLPAFRDGGSSVYWSSLAFALLLAGIKKRLKTLRLCAIGLFVIVAFKIFFHDLADLEQIWRITAFAVIGIVMLVGAVVYIKFKDMFIKDDEVQK